MLSIEVQCLGCTLHEGQSRNKGYRGRGNRVPTGSLGRVVAVKVDFLLGVLNMSYLASMILNSRNEKKRDSCSNKYHWSR